MKKYGFFFLLILILFNQILFGQQSISSFVKDTSTNEVLIGVNIKSKRTYTTTNNYGYFSLQSISVSDTIIFSMLGYQTKKITIDDLKVNNAILLVQNSTRLAEITIRKEPDNRLTTETIGTLNIPIDRIKRIPALFGETDIIKALSLTPGVMTAQEGTSGLIVRGGSPDQNLILLDEAPVYNVSHLFGLASIFNPDAVKNVTFYKSSFPARFGGRLSSVIDVQTKNGNTNKRVSEMTLGILSSRFIIEGPIKLPKTTIKSTYMFTARSSYLNLFTWPLYIQYKNHANNYLNYWLYDINAKVNTTYKDKSRLFVSYYSGLDNFKILGSVAKGYDSGFRLNWHNQTSTIRYVKPIKEKLFIKLVGVYTNYQYLNKVYSISPNVPKQTFYLKSQISDLIFKAGAEYFPNRFHSIKTGIELTRHHYTPNYTEVNKKSIDTGNQQVGATELVAYTEDDISLLPNLNINLGLRAVQFILKNKNYSSFEPRASVNLDLSAGFALKLGYAKQTQYLHQLVNTMLGVPNEIWVPVTVNTPPQRSNQIAFGLSKNISSMYEVSIEVYRKNLRNLIDLKIGENFLTNYNTSWEETIARNGIGEVKGAEFFLNKTKGLFTGWAAYTLSKSSRRFDEINNGEWYDFYFDRRHSIAITGSWQPQSRPLSFAASWVFQTGIPVTVPVASKLYYNKQGGISYEAIYEKLNNFRMPSYHRLDVSLTKNSTTKRGYKKQWVFGLYNAYSQINPFYIKITPKLISESAFSFTGKEIDYNVKLTKQAFLPILPFVSYTRSFSK